MKRPAGRWRWRIVVLLFFLSVINYLDRQALSVLAPTLREELDFTVEHYSYIVASFLAAYTLGLLFCGRVLDRMGTRGGISFAILFWSTATCSHALARSWRHLAASRFFLGLGESFNAPGGAKVIREWIPRKERALSMAVFSTGNIAGAVLAPPLIGYLALHFDWRPAFLVSGFLGFLWWLFWIKYYRSPEQHPRLSEAERALILAERSASETQAADTRFWDVVRHPATLAFMAARFLTDSVPYFFSFWLPEYLKLGHGFGLSQIAMMAWIPYLAADVGGLSGGAASDWLVRRGWSAPRARRRVLLAAACLTPAAFLAVRAEAALVSLLCVGAVLAAHSAWITNLLTLMTESVPARVSAQVVAWSSVGGSIGGILSNLATGRVVARWGYRPVFSVLGFLHLTAFMLVRLLADRSSARPDGAD
jgi:ACS family hexuronate transporter-like MFS transporter